MSKIIFKYNLFSKKRTGNHQNENNYSNNIIFMNYDEMDLHNIKLSSLIFNDNFKYLTICYKDFIENKLFIKIDNINKDDIELKKDECDFVEIKNIKKSLFFFIELIEKYIFNLSIKELKNWYENYDFFYNSMINDDKITFKFYNDVKFINNLNKNVNILFNIYSVNTDIDILSKKIYLNLYIKLISIEL